MEDIRVRGQAKELGAVLTAVVVDGTDGKEYRLPTDHERTMAADAANHIDRVFTNVPFGVPEEPTPAGGGRGAGRAFSVQGYGLMKLRDLFTSRQLLALGTFIKWTRRGVEAASSPLSAADEGTRRDVASTYPPEWKEAIAAALAIGMDRIADRQSTICRGTWDIQSYRGHSPVLPCRSHGTTAKVTHFQKRPRVIIFPISNGSLSILSTRW
jgi:adenine-specific DNA methylase